MESTALARPVANDPQKYKCALNTVGAESKGKLLKEWAGSIQKIGSTFIITENLEHTLPTVVPSTDLFRGDRVSIRLLPETKQLQFLYFKKDTQANYLSVVASLVFPGQTNLDVGIPLEHGFKEDNRANVIQLRLSLNCDLGLQSPSE